MTGRCPGGTKNVPPGHEVFTAAGAGGGPLW